MMKMISASNLRRLVSEKIRHVECSPEKFCSSVSELIGRPSLMLPPSFPVEGGMEYKFYSPLKEEIVRFNNRGGKKEADLMQHSHTNWMGSSHGWLVLYNFRSNYNTRLVNPLSGSSLHLPPFPKQPYMNNQIPQFPYKVILSHSPLEQECRALAVHGQFDRLSFCHPVRSGSWTPLGPGYDESRDYNDFVYYASRKVFVTVNRVCSGWWFTDELEFWDPSSMESPVKTLRGPPFSIFHDPACSWRTYLVVEEESGQLFMVRRYDVDHTRVDYKVYSVDSYGEDVVVQPRDSLGDLLMFIGMNHCFAAKASKYPEYNPNCIYFSGPWFNQNQFLDTYDYHTRAYTHLFDISPTPRPGHRLDFPFKSTLPWFTLAHDEQLITHAA